MQRKERLPCSWYQFRPELGRVAAVPAMMQWFLWCEPTLAAVAWLEGRGGESTSLTQLPQFVVVTDQ